MTNSSVSDPSAKPVKKKGPIRTGAVVPVTVLILICFVFFKFFFDWSLKRGLAMTGTYIAGSEVNVGSVHTSFLNGSIRVTNIQVTDKSQPTRNVVQIGEVRFGFLWDGLLRLKFVVNDAGIDGIQVYSPRAKAGWVKPPEPPKPEAASSGGTLDDIQNSITAQVSGNSKGNALDGLTKLLSGTNPGDLLKTVQGGLKSKAKIEALQSELTQKQKDWQDRINKMPQKKDIDALVERAKKLKFNTGDPAGFANDLKSATEIKKDADKIFDSAKDTTKALQTDVDHFKTEYKDIDQLVRQDVADVQSKLNLGDMDTKTLSKTLFMNYLSQKLGSYAKYLALAQKYMPAGGNKGDSSSQKNDLVPHSRSKGRNIRFPITTSYPLFWLKYASISSKVTDEGFSGNISGSLMNVTTDPAVVGKPAVLDVHGDFPKANVYKAHLNVTLDHVRDPVDAVEIGVGAFPVQGMPLVSGSDVSLGLKDATGQSLIRASYKDSQINFQMNNAFNNVKYDLKASSKTVNDILGGILANISQISLEASATGPITGLSVSMNSNLGEKLADGVKKYVQTQLDDVRGKIQSQINDQISGPKKQLADQLSQATGGVTQSLNLEQQQMSQAQKDVGNSTKAPGGSNGIQQLLNGIHF